MAGFIKTFLLGILYTVLSPFIVLLLALYAVYCIFVFIYMAIRNLIIFFAGGNPMGDLPEEVKAKKIMQDAETKPNDNDDNNKAVDVDATDISETATEEKKYTVPSSNEDSLKKDNGFMDVFSTSSDDKEGE